MNAVNGSQSPDRPEADELLPLDAYFRAANYLTAGQIYLMDNPLLRRTLVPEDIKPRLLGHWGTSPGLNFIYAHLSRCIKALDLSAIFVCGPGPVSYTHLLRAIGDGCAVDDDAYTHPIGRCDERDVHGRSRGGSKGVHALDPCARQEGLEGRAGDVGNTKINTLEH